MCLKIEMQNSFTQFSATEQRLEPYARRTYTRREHISRCVSCDAKMRQEAPVINEKNDANLRQRKVPPLYSLYYTKCFQVVTFYEEEGEIRFDATGKKRPKFLF